MRIQQQPGNEKTPHCAGSFQRELCLVLVLAGRVTRMAFLTASEGVFAIGTGGGASMVLARVCMVSGMCFGLYIAFTGPFGAGGTGLFTGATASGFGFGSGGSGACRSAGMSLLAVQVGVCLASASGGATVFHQNILCGGRSGAGLRIGRGEKAGEGEHAQEVLHSSVIVRLLRQVILQVVKLTRVAVRSDNDHAMNGSRFGDLPVKAARIALRGLSDAAPK